MNEGRPGGRSLPKHVCSIRVRLEIAGNKRDLALFNLAVDTKLRGCDLVRLKVKDVFAAGRVKERASVTQSKTGKPVRFEITEATRSSLERWVADPEMIGQEYLWPCRLHASVHLSTREYARILRGWVQSIDRAEAERLWNAFDATHEGGTDLQENGKLASGTAFARPHQDGQHGAIPRCRS
ncbi:tyrosine-type recombinase/integrase [Paracoccus ravus]|uniref:tyrosine-type recombinase/integrase n=1 Tax=Paracoccus ravus TaxID=2447760 RepID=UPI00106EB2F5|nr:tyrosine-type recombinase/integrase [Paracoccus ravus]